MREGALEANGTCGSGAFTGHTQPHSGPTIHRVPIKPGGNVRNNITIKRSVELLRDVSDVRSREHVFKPTERMRRGQRLLVEDINGGARDRAQFQSPDQGT